MINLLYKDQHFEVYGNDKIQYFRIESKYYMNDHPEEFELQSPDRLHDKEITQEQFNNQTSKTNENNNS